MQFGLIGFPLGHSFSKGFFERKFKKEKGNHAYLNFEFESMEEAWKAVQKLDDVKGLNVTIPHKESVMAFVDELDQSAQEVGAVNCIKRTNEGWMGFNTDVIAFRYSLETSLVNDGPRALVFGTGGASKAICSALRNMKIPHRIVSRSSGDLAYHELDEKVFRDAHLLINCSPVGMLGFSTERLPFDHSWISPSHFLYDLVYNPKETPFLEAGRKVGAKTKNGEEMLILQAEESWKIWMAD